MLTDPQIWKLKAAQKQAGIDDEEYRSTLRQLCGVSTSKDAALGNEQWDMLMSYFEAVYWRGMDAGRLPRPCKATAPFQQPGYWSSKNTCQETSRDRYTVAGINEEIEAIEKQLAALGYGPAYFSAIKNKVIPAARANMTWPQGLVKYRAALQRTLAAKLKSRWTSR